MKRILVVVLALAATPAFAATTSNVTVTATITPVCSISTTDNLTFTYDPVAGNRAPGADAVDDASVEVICTNAGDHSIEFSAGGHAAGNQRAMAQGTTPLNYSLFDGSTELLPGQKMTVTTATAGEAKTVTIQGRVAGGQMVPSGTYTDTVVATVNL